MEVTDINKKSNSFLVTLVPRHAVFFVGKIFLGKLEEIHGDFRTAFGMIGVGAGTTVPFKGHGSGWNALKKKNTANLFEELARFEIVVFEYIAGG